MAGARIPDFLHNTSGNTYPNYYSSNRVVDAMQFNKTVHSIRQQFLSGLMDQHCSVSNNAGHVDDVVRGGLSYASLDKGPFMPSDFFCELFEMNVQSNNTSADIKAPGDDSLAVHDRFVGVVSSFSFAYI